MRRGTLALCALALGLLAPEYSGADAGSAPVRESNGEDNQATRPTDTDSNVIELEEIVIEARRPLTAASSDEIRALDYELRPHATPQEILNNVPGLVATQHQGGAKATQYLVRGFDSDHGTDFALYVDDLPVNLPTHGHGQGYADLNFLIPETVDRLQLFKGPYFADLGDFATAGALKISTLDEFDESFVRAEGGSFDTQRYVAGASPRLPWGKTLVAAEAYFTNGPFEDEQNLARYNVFGKITFEPSPTMDIAVTGSVYDADWDASGQIPLREVSAGRLDRFGSLDATEGGSTDRENLNLQLTSSPSAEDEVYLQFYASRYSLRLYSNFTFFQDTGSRFVEQADGVVCDKRSAPCNPAGAVFIPGDGIAQDDNRIVFGSRARYTRSWSAGPVGVQSKLGFETRRDDVDVALHRQVRRTTFFTVNQVNVKEQSLSAYVQHQLFLTEWLRFEGGLRGDVYWFDGADRLPGQGPDPNFESVAVGGRESDYILGPKANLIVTPLADTDLYANFGIGFHSNDARVVLDTGRSALVEALGYELGARTRRFDRLDVAAALWLIDLDSELTFSGDGGRVDADVDPITGNFIPGGSTRRWGIDFETRLRAADWLFFDYDLTYADPRFRSGGGAVPLAPTLVMNGGASAEFDNGFSAALRARFVDDRPASEDRSLNARGYTLIDLLAKYRWRNVEASLQLFNLANFDWRETQFGDPSCVAGEVGVDPACPIDGNGEGVTDIHFTPGNPFAARGGLTVYF
jgi:outer membrane receptor protein involved in Fe transport